jgi:hypothetical protein
MPNLDNLVLFYINLCSAISNHNFFIYKKNHNEKKTIPKSTLFNLASK